MADLRRRDEAAGFSDFEPSEFVGQFLEHHGVKGMHWGHHKARTPEQKASRNRKLKVAGATAVVAGAAVTALVLKHNGNVNAAKVVEAAAAAARHAKENPIKGVNGKPPTPFEMQIVAGMAAQKNALNKAAAQNLTLKAWEDSVKIKQASKQMDDLTLNLLGNTNAMLKGYGQ